MTLALLASAQTLADDVDAWGMPRLRALLPIAGMTLIEQQAERARSVGVSQLFILVDGVPPALTEACDRIRSRGVSVDLVRDGRGVAALAAGADHMLLAADGLVAGEAPWQAVAGARGSGQRAAMLVTADGHATQTLERIDATTRWAGLASVPRAALAQIADAPSDWDPQLLLFRRAVQDGASRIEWDSERFVSGDMVLASSAVAASEAEARLMGAAGHSESGIGSRWLVGPLVQLASGPLLGAQNSGVAARSAAIVGAIVAGGAALAGQPLLAIAIGLLAAVAHGAGDFVAGFRPERPAVRRARIAGFALQIAAFAAVERGVQATATAAWSGSGTMAATMMLLASIALRRRPSGRPLLDLPAAWIGMALVLPYFGRDAASLVVGAAGLMLLIVAERTVPSAAARSDDPAIPGPS